MFTWCFTCMFTCSCHLVISCHILSYLLNLFFSNSFDILKLCSCDMLWYDWHIFSHPVTKMWVPAILAFSKAEIFASSEISLDVRLAQWMSSEVRCHGVTFIVSHCLALALSRTVSPSICSLCLCRFASCQICLGAVLQRPTKVMGLSHLSLNR